MMRAVRAACVAAACATAACVTAAAPLTSICDASGACGDDSVNPEAARARARLTFDLADQLSPPIPRVSAEELKLPGNEAFRRRERPYILTGAIDDWPALRKWHISKEAVDAGTDYLSNLFPEAVTDLYPYNMLEQGTHPYLSRFKRGLWNVLNEPGDYTRREGKFHCDGGCRYVHMQLDHAMWDKLEELGDIPRKRHMLTNGDNWWWRRCLQDTELQDEFSIKTHWRIILIGTQSSGMFMHSDSLLSSSWHAHIQGEKIWMVCAPDDRNKCMEAVLKPGEVLFYGRGWYHTTRNMDKPSMTVTGTVVTGDNHEHLADKLWGECARSEMGFGFSSKLCDSLDQCYPLWHRVLKGKPAPKGRWVPWREAATADEITKKEAKRPSSNNYDGSNFIAENR